MHVRTILVVDDEEMIIKAIKRTLRNEDYNILTANSAADGLRMLEDQL